MLASGLVGADGAFTTMLERGTAVGFVDSRENVVVGRVEFTVTELLSPGTPPVIVAVLVPEAVVPETAVVPEATGGGEDPEIEVDAPVATVGGTWRALISKCSRATQATMRAGRTAADATKEGTVRMKKARKGMRTKLQENALLIRLSPPCRLPSYFKRI